MVLCATFKNNSAISWRSVLFVEEMGVPETTDLLQVTDKFYHIMLHPAQQLYLLYPIATLD